MPILAQKLSRIGDWGGSNLDTNSLQSGSVLDAIQQARHQTADGQSLYDYFVTQAREAHPIVQTGQFAADMKVHLINDGPVTIPMHV